MVRWYTDFEVDFHLEHRVTSSLARVRWYLCSLFSVECQDKIILSTGDYGGAIEDFEFYAEWARENGGDEQDRAKREYWIGALREGENPFTEEVLKELLEE